MNANPRDRYLVFALGAATGSAIGLVIGALATFWLGDEAADGLKRALRRLFGRDDRVNFELFLQ
ncbi:MAG: hypothetical protein H0X37_14500 [Herpetosiphonaceae bacterium]|nr:hypothetical protein [Herpetosiphonaceae bacterium]